jgi:hypothetical protein
MYFVENTLFKGSGNICCMTTTASESIMMDKKDSDRLGIVLQPYLANIISIAT